jgi:hypothetical protein
MSMPLRRMICKEGRKWEDYPLVSVANMETINTLSDSLC